MPNPSGPFPNQFTRAQQSETFTSDGPRRVFYNPDGTEITPGNLTSTGGSVRQKPDITAADGVSTSVAGLRPVLRHLGGGPARRRDRRADPVRKPGHQPGRGARGADRHGDRHRGPRLRPRHRLRHRDAGAGAQAHRGHPAAAGHRRRRRWSPPARDGDAFLEPGESATVSVPVTNRGDGTATGVSVQVSTPTAGATVRPASRSYGNIKVGVDQGQPFTVSVPASFPLGGTVAAAHPGQLRRRAVAAVRHEVDHRSASRGAGADFAYTGPPVAIPDDDAAGVERAAHRERGRQRRPGDLLDRRVVLLARRSASTTVGLDHTFVGTWSARWWRRTAPR